MASKDSKSEPTVINLDNNNSVQILSQYVELAQSKGAFVLAEAELLKRATDVILNNVPDQEIGVSTARQLMMQGVHKGQRHGAYTLNDAALLSKVVQFVSANLQAETQQPVSSSEPSKTESDDLSDLAEPIPLKPKEV
jgi:hypothetical protein